MTSHEFEQAKLVLTPGLFIVVLLCELFRQNCAKIPCLVMISSRLCQWHRPLELLSRCLTMRQRRRDWRSPLTPDHEDEDENVPFYLDVNVIEEHALTAASLASHIRESERHVMTVGLPPAPASEALEAFRTSLPDVLSMTQRESSQQNR